MTKRLLIIFGKRTADEILSAARLADDGYFDSMQSYFFEDELLDDQRLTRIPAGFNEIHYCIGATDYKLRASIEASASARGWIPYTVIHPTAVIDVSAKIGSGCFIGPLATVSIDAVVEDHSIIHLQSSIGHDSRVGSHCTVLPGARISGNVSLGDGVLIGSNAFIFQGSQVGAHTQVDALTYVRGEIPPWHLVSIRHPRPLKRPDRPRVEG